MSSIAWLVLIFSFSIILGLLILILPIIGFYWGPTGKPPANRQERRKLREEELRLRAQQIEKSKNNPVVTRNPSFWNNRKVFK
jgi:hypothetical protein